MPGNLALVSSFGSLPVIMIAGFLRIKIQLTKSKLQGDPFAKGTSIALEAIGAIRTVSELNMQPHICSRLEDETRSAVPILYGNVMVTMPLFAFSQSANLLGKTIFFESSVRTSGIDQI